MIKFLVSTKNVSVHHSIIRVHLRPKMLKLQYFNRQVTIGIDADVGGDIQGALDNVARTELGAVQQGARGRLRERPARTDGDQPALGLDDAGLGGGDERRRLV